MMASGVTQSALRPVTAAGTLATAAALKAPYSNEQANAAGTTARLPTFAQSSLPKYVSSTPPSSRNSSSNAETIAQQRAAQVRNAVTQTAPLPPKRSDYFPPSSKQKVDYQSNNQPVTTAEGRINWGDSDSAADFFRASKALQANPNAVGVGSSADTGMASGGTVDRAMKVAKHKATPCHSGIINMAVGGRTDHIPMNVLEGSYVLPADIVSGLGEGNTLAGTKIIDQMFGSGPFGVKTPGFRASPHIPSPNYQYRPTSPYEPTQFQARGGRTNAKRPVPIIAAGGEYVVHPDVVARLGNGDMDKGHEYLDNFVKYVRQETAKTLNKLPPPRKN
jgi:hypothetical protein